MIAPHPPGHRTRQPESNPNKVRKKSALLFSLSCPTFPAKARPSFRILERSEVGCLFYSIFSFSSGQKKGFPQKGMWVELVGSNQDFCQDLFLVLYSGGWEPQAALKGG